jgi:light-harvesting complex 1 alpha chain
MYKLWLLFDPRRVLVAIGAMLFVLALIIHFLCLGSEKFNWLEGHPYKAAQIQQTTAILLG